MGAIETAFYDYRALTETTEATEATGSSRSPRSSPRRPRRPTAGKKYWGLAIDQTHLAWVSNLLDQRSLRLTQEGHMLWQSLSDLIREHFQEVVLDQPDDGAAEEGESSSE